MAINKTWTSGLSYFMTQAAKRKGKELAKNLGYHQPDHCVWWEATDPETNEACFHGKTLREVEFMILESEFDDKLRAANECIDSLNSLLNESGYDCEDEVNAILAKYKSAVQVRKV